MPRVVMKVLTIPKSGDRCHGVKLQRCLSGLNQPLATINQIFTKDRWAGFGMGGSGRLKHLDQIGVH
jgi:hypothetical protein